MFSDFCYLPWNCSGIKTFTLVINAIFFNFFFYVKNLPHENFLGLNSAIV